MYLTILLILITCIVSYMGISNKLLISQYAFSVDKVQRQKEYYRFVTSGFLHVDYLHLIINMIVLYGFGHSIELSFGFFYFLLIYFSSMIGGNLLALFIHKHSPAYTSVGASGAISGLVFTMIAYQPNLRILIIPAWLFGIAYVLLTIYAIRAQRTDVGHAAHLGGALIGMIVSLTIYPQIIFQNWLPILAILLPGIALIIVLLKKPDLIMIDKKTRRRQLTLEDRYNLSRKNQQEEVDRILEKINKEGINKLTQKERDILDNYSRS